MQISIVTSDAVVCVDRMCFHDMDMTGVPSDVHALQWKDTSGHIEYQGHINEDIDALPSWVDAIVAAWQVKKDLIDNPPPLTEEQQIRYNQSKSTVLLQESDWAALPDVGLANQNEWLAYRAALREIRTNTTLDPVWPTMPQVIWA